MGIDYAVAELSGAVKVLAAGDGDLAARLQRAWDAQASRTLDQRVPARAPEHAIQGSVGEVHRTLGRQVQHAAAGHGRSRALGAGHRAREPCR